MTNKELHHRKKDDKYFKKLKELPVTICPLKKEEFDLSEKRKKLREQSMGLSIDTILNIIEEQDKEFIRLLKEELLIYTELNKSEINKIFDEVAGSKLTGDKS